VIPGGIGEEPGASPRARDGVLASAAGGSAGQLTILDEPGRTRILPSPTGCDRRTRVDATGAFCSSVGLSGAHAAGLGLPCRPARPRRADSFPPGEAPEVSLETGLARGGFPRTEHPRPAGRDAVPRWQDDYLKLLVARDLPTGPPAKPQLTERLLAWSPPCTARRGTRPRSEDPRALVRHRDSYLEYLEGRSHRAIAPYAANLKKRIVKSRSATSATRACSIAPRLSRAGSSSFNPGWVRVGGLRDRADPRRSRRARRAGRTVLPGGPAIAMSSICCSRSWGALGVRDQVDVRAVTAELRSPRETAELVSADWKCSSPDSGATP